MTLSTPALYNEELSHFRLKIETEAWTPGGVTTSVGTSYVLEPGHPVQTTLYDGKLYTLTITTHHELGTTVRILKVRRTESEGDMVNLSVSRAPVIAPAVLVRVPWRWRSPRRGSS